MYFIPSRLPAIVFLTVGLLCACSQTNQPPAMPGAATQQAARDARDAQAAQKLSLYQTMLAQHRDDLAVPIGQEIVTDFAGTPAAAEVQKTLPGIEAKAKATAEHDRLAALWSYQTTLQSGAKQSSATIYSSKPGGQDRVQLVLRRHAKWGQSVYLFGSGRGFECKATCTLPMRLDGRRENWKAYLPETGEPALFIKDDTRFIAVLSKTKTIEMDVTLKGRGRETLTFEVAGYDPARFPKLPKK